MKDRGKQRLDYALSIYVCVIQGNYQDNSSPSGLQYCNSSQQIVANTMEGSILEWCWLAGRQIFFSPLFHITVHIQRKSRFQCHKV